MSDNSIDSLKNMLRKLLEIKYNDIYNDEKMNYIINTYNGDFMKIKSDIKILKKELNVKI